MSRTSPGLRHTDIGNVERLVREHGTDLRYVPAWGWLAWDGTRWRLDPSKDGEITRRAMTIADLLLREATNEPDGERRKVLTQHALMSAGRRSIESMVRLGSAAAELQAEPEAFDGAAHLFNVANGTIDLRTSELRPHRREDAITKLSPLTYDPTAQAPRFLSFLREIMRGDEQKTRFLQLAAGYSLTGETFEQCLFFLLGLGANGKGTLLRLLSDVAGEYYQQAEFSTFLARANDTVREDIASLVGARIVAAEETKKGAQWDEGLIKTLTGQDRISTRFLHARRFTFRPTFKLWFAANDRPKIAGVDNGIWRRMRLVPFEHQIETPDPSIEQFMREHELFGILAWAVEGSRLWYRERLPLPPSVKLATEQYREDEDVLGQFLNSCCENCSDAEVLASDLYARYRGWATDQGMIEREILTQTRFGRELSSRGFARKRNGNGQVVRTGLSLISSVRIVRTVTHPTPPYAGAHTRTGEESPGQLFDCSNHSESSYESDERLAMQEDA